MECQTREYKEVWKDDRLRTLPSFANSDGGVLCVLGMVRRNPLVADVFYRMGSMAAWGRSFTLMTRDARDHGKLQSRMSAAALAKELGISGRKVIKNTNKLNDLDLLRREGNIKSGTWDVRT